MSPSVDVPGGAPAAVATGLGFGCAELFRLPSARARRRVLDAALDAGIVHVDVAPMYGLGLAEGELGAVLRGRRDRIAIATKFGIGVTPLARAIGTVQGPIRRVMRARPEVHAAARDSGAGPASGPVGALLYRDAGYDASAARRSLQQSLRALRTDHVDLLLLHDPPPSRVAADLAGHLQQLAAEGLIGAWGVAGEVADAVAAAQRLGPRTPVLQIRDNLLRRGLEALPPQLGARRITFGTLGEVIAPILAHVHADADVRRAWSRAIGRDTADPDVVAALLLRDARRRNPDGLTLFSTTRPERIAPAVAAGLGGADDESVDALRALIAATMDDRWPAELVA